MRERAIEDLLRRCAPQVLGALVRRNGRFDACEEAVQEALLAAAQQWPADGVPDQPVAWLTTVANRRLVDGIRSDAARRGREERDAREELPRVDNPDVPDDDALRLLFLCCHPALTPASQVALTLRAVGGLTTAEIASAFLMPESTMARRISRAKQQIRNAGARFELPLPEEAAARLGAVLHVLYLIFNEGYTTSAGRDVHRNDLTDEAIRLTRDLAALVPQDGETTGLLALMLLTEARRPARTDAAGNLIPLDEQDRSRWDAGMIEDGVALVSAVLPRGAVGPYQLQAAIAAVHDEAPTAKDTDWPQILALYTVLDRIAPNPMATLNQAVAVAEVHGPRAALELLATLDGDPRLAGHHRLHAVRAHLLEELGDRAAAREEYREAARRTKSFPEQRYLNGRAHRLS